MPRVMINHTRMLALALVACVGCAPPAPDESVERGVATQAEATVEDPQATAVVHVVQTILDAINSADSELARTVVPADAQVVAVRAGASGVISGADFAAGIGDPEQGFVERIWDPEVKILGPVAMGWAPYDFYIHGEFSHCGVDTFQLVWDGDAWKVQSLVYSVLQPPECDLHPDGPPPG